MRRINNLSEYSVFKQASKQFKQSEKKEYNSHWASPTYALISTRLILLVVPLRDLKRYLA